MPGSFHALAGSTNKDRAASMFMDCSFRKSPPIRGPREILWTSSCAVAENPFFFLEGGDDSGHRASTWLCHYSIHCARGRTGTSAHMRLNALSMFSLATPVPLMLAASWLKRPCPCEHSVAYMLLLTPLVGAMIDMVDVPCHIQLQSPLRCSSKAAVRQVQLLIAPLGRKHFIQLLLFAMTLSMINDLLRAAAASTTSYHTQESGW